MSRKLQLLTGFSVISLVLALSLSIIALNPVDAAPGDFDLDGRDLILDADGDTIIDSNADDSIVITVNGTPLPDTISNDTKFRKNIRLTSNETRTSTVTLSNTPLQIAAAANSLYTVEFNFIWDSGVSAQNGKIGFLVPSGATFDGLGCGAVFGSGGSAYCSRLDETGSFVLGVDATTKTYTVRGILDTAGSSGTFALQLAQDVSNGNPQTMYADSNMSWEKLNR